MNTNTLTQETDSQIKVAPAPELPRLAFSLQETADMLGLSYITVFRLVQRGKLKSCGQIRHKLIARQEIDRFLRS